MIVMLLVLIFSGAIPLTGLVLTAIDAPTAIDPIVSFVWITIAFFCGGFALGIKLAQSKMLRL